MNHKEKEAKNENIRKVIFPSKKDENNIKIISSRLLMENKNFLEVNILSTQGRQRKFGTLSLHVLCIRGDIRKGKIDRNNNRSNTLPQF